MEVLKVSQFFETKGMTWTDFRKCKDVPVCISTDGTSCLWKETPTIVEDTTLKPHTGEVWLKEGDNNTIEILKENYDTSD